ncbi:MAG: hypothetical protein ABIK62_07960 [candidate division WOR-3 bacterium]
MIRSFRLSWVGMVRSALVIGVAGLTRCSESPEVLREPTNRIVLAEFFTWARCAYCPHAASALDSLAREFADSVALVAYHRRIAGDTISPAYVEKRCSRYYSGGGEPATVFDGYGPVRTASPEENLETFRNHILVCRSRSPKVQLHLTGDVSLNRGRAVIQVCGLDSAPAGGLRLFTAVVEDSVCFKLSGAYETLFNHVLRLMLPNEDGRLVTNVGRDTFAVAEEFALAPEWNPRMLGIVAFVQDTTTNQVLQTSLVRRLPWSGRQRN